MQSVMPVTIIGGYLGSGKTTLVNHLLRHANGVRLAVLVNDFGELPIDADLIEAQDSDVISLSGGCVCCSYGDDLSLSLQKLQAQDSLPEHIFIEASGVALPGAIGQSLSLQRAYQLEGIVVLADATRVQQSAVDKYIGDTIQQQLTDADLIVLNKVDLLTAANAYEVRQWLLENYAQAPLVNSVFGKIDPETLFAIRQDHLQTEPNRQIEPNKDYLKNHSHHAESLFTSIHLEIDHAVDANALAAQLADADSGLVRAKGFVLHRDNTLKTIQVVGRRWSITNAPAGVKPGLVCIGCSGEFSQESIRALCKLDA